MCNCGARRRAPDGGGGRSIPSAAARAPMNRRAPPSPRTPPPRMINGIQVRDPAIWGPPLWAVLHGMAEFGAATIPFSDWQELAAALRTSLPCEECSLHYQRWYRVRLPPPTGPIAQWLLDLHNDVNRRRRQPAWTAAQLTAHYAARDRVMEAVQMRERVEGLRGIIGTAAVDVMARMAGKMVVPS